MEHKKQIAAFSLIELSIVIIIIGLLIAGVTSGGHLIHQARLQKLLKNVDSLKTSVATFQGIHNYQLPGDADGINNFYTTSLIDGNGDGEISWNKEGVNAWHHLAVSEIYPNSIAPIKSKIDKLTNNHSFSTKLDNGKLSFIYCNSSLSRISNNIATCNENTLDDKSKITAGNYLLFGKIDNISRSTNKNGYNHLPIIKAVDAFNIDQKLDDGSHNTGVILAIGTTGGTTEEPSDNCVTPATQSGKKSDYAKSNKNKSCALLFKLH